MCCSLSFSPYFSAPYITGCITSSYSYLSTPDLKLMTIYAFLNAPNVFLDHHLFSFTQYLMDLIITGSTIQIFERSHNHCHIAIQLKSCLGFKPFPFHHLKYGHLLFSCPSVQTHWLRHEVFQPFQPSVPCPPWTVVNLEIYLSVPR